MGNATVTDRPISKEQIKIIHTLKTKMGMSERVYRQRLGRVGVKSCKEMTYERAKGFIRYLKIAAAKKLGKVYARSNGSERISQKQMDKARKMWEQVSILDDPDAREAALNKLVERLYHVSALNWLPATKAPGLFKALEAMRAQKVGKETMQAAQEALVGASAAPETAESAPIAAVNG